jgi:hypothetical protein
MIDTINPWLDPVEVRRMAERLMQPARDPVAPLADPGFDDTFIGFGSESRAYPAQPLNAALRQLPKPAADPVPPALPALVPIPAPPAIPLASEVTAVTARGPFLERILHFRDWMRRNFSATGLFILDREGAVIYDESDHGRLHFMARSLALASRRTGATGRNVHVKISAEATLEVIPVDTPYGCLVLGAVVPESLNPESISAVMGALLSVASPRIGA